MTDRITLFFVHGLGCSARLWQQVVARLEPEFECVALDLPGHGAAADSGELTVEQMAEFVAGRVREHRPRRWGLIGHSMGAKIATIVTARAERSADGLCAPLGLALVSGSPLSPEPMDEATRARMIGWRDDGPMSETDAQSFVDANTSKQLPEDVRSAAVADVRTASRAAWVGWLGRGSLEDWRDAVGTVHTPTLVVAGADDDDLGVEAQRALTVVHVNAEQVHSVPGVTHLLPLEDPTRLAGLVREHFNDVVARTSALPSYFADLLISDRVSARTRGVLLDRLATPDETNVLDGAQRATLAALVARVVPQRGTEIDLVSRLDAQLADAVSDGWRFADLPSDAEAWRRGLDTLDAESAGYASLSAADQDRWITRIIAGEVGSDEPDRLSAAQLTLWFEDVRAEAVRTWLSHPAALAALGYDGFANGGDGVRKQGYLLVGPDQRDPWQADLGASAS